jgi:hypothetical protein
MARSAGLVAKLGLALLASLLMAAFAPTVRTSQGQC